jgi:hypothetical protein
MTNTGCGLERTIKFRQCMGPSVAWGDALRLKPAVCRKSLEQCNDLLEESDSFSARGAVGGEARRIQGAVASPMCGPLVLGGHETRRHDADTGRTSQKASLLSSSLIQNSFMNSSVEVAPWVDSNCHSKSDRDNVEHRLRTYGSDVRIITTRVTVLGIGAVAAEAF